MKPLVLYLLCVFLATCGMLMVVKSIDPPEPVLLVDAAAPVEKPPVPTFTCIYIVPPLDKNRRGITHA